MVKLYRAKTIVTTYYYVLEDEDPEAEGKAWLGDSVVPSEPKLIELVEIASDENVPNDDLGILPHGHDHENPEIGSYSVADYLKNLKGL